MSFKRTAMFAPLPAPTRGQAVHMGSNGTNFLYTNGRAVIIRNLERPEIAKEYVGHTAPTTVARYAPSGFYIASADVQGNIRIWDTTQEENIIKTETKVFSGRVTDLDWDFESKRIIAVGEGKDRFGHAFLFDTASSVGEISGHSKVINSVSIRPGRPLRAVTGSDDMTVNFYHGVPFKFNKSLTNHSRFVQCVRYSPNGDFFVSTGSDGKVFIYDGKTGDNIAELSAAQNSHSGGVYSVSWSGDSKQIMTASADQTVKIWDIAAQKVAQTFNFSDAPTTDDQQVGCLWQGNTLISLSLSGDLNYLDPTSGGRPTRVISGHSKGITSLAVDANKTLYSGSYDGRVCSWTDGKNGGTVVSGAGHTNQIISLVADQDKIVTAAMDDSMRSISTKTKAFEPQAVATGAVPKSLASRGATSIVVTIKDEVIVSTNGAKQSTIKTPYTPSSVAISPDGKTAAIGGEDGLVHIYSIDGASLNETSKIEGNKGTITAMAYSPNGDLLAVADSQRTVMVYNTATGRMRLNQWVFHTAKVNSIAWSPDGLHAVSGSLDTNVEVWSVEKPMKHISIKGAHQDSVTGAVFLDNDTIASSGQDAQIKIWSLTHH
ncbi:quinon protein alcohol dehydrogenase-like superfamily [Entophlyctis helioformis]|nr:quinon protein alcohol dehydrogenase-like superfamily [Entophlyctis helioformis]